MKGFIALVLVGLTALANLGPATADEDKSNNEIVKIVYFATDRPLLIELCPLIDGRSCQDAYRDCMAKVFDYLDVNKDGVLSKSEAAGAPAPAALAGPNALFGLRVGPQGKTNMDADGDGKVSREELAAHYKRGGLRPFGLSFRPRDTGVIDLNAYNPEGSASAEAINNRLFELLDTDKDGRLSRKELEAAAAILGKLDADEDEMLTTAELQGLGGVRTDTDGGKFAFAVDPSGMKPANLPFHLLGDGAEDAALAKQLLQRYGKKGDKGLSAEQLRVGEKTFAALDRDGDGLLDEQELAGFGRLQGEARFTVRLGKRDTNQTVVSVDRASDRVAVQPKGDGVELTMGNVRVELAGPKPAPNFNVNFNAKDQYVNQFRMADTDNNGYLDKAEAEKSPFFRNTFAAMDRDGDGMLYEKEMLAYLDGIESLRKLANKSCLTLTVMDEGKGLFERIDRDGDGRLSVRELRQMPRLLEQLDADGDGYLARDEIPRRYKGTFDLGSSAGGPGGARAIVFRAGMGGPAPAPAKTKGPVWFRKMDRNRDGDVSRREWLGTDEEFRAIDTDGDGLISLQEAERYDALKRGKSN
jgi:Ca2+-binding EF-hand superfamily protein